MQVLTYHKHVQGSKLSFFSGEPNSIFKSYLKVLCIETSTSLGSLHIFDRDVGEFKGVLGSRHPLISSPDVIHCHKAGGSKNNSIGEKSKSL